MTQDVEVLWVARYDYREGWRMNIPHKHDYFQIMYIIDGSGRYMLEETEHEILPGSLFLIKPFRVHQLLATTNTTLKTFDIKFVVHSQELTGQLETGLSVYNLANQDNNSIFKKIREEGVKRSAYFKELSSLYLLEMVYHLLRLSLNQEETVNEESSESLFAGQTENLCSTIMEYIKKHYKEELTLRSLAEALGYNQSYICQVFKQNMKATPMRFLYTHRINKAKELIAYSDYHLKEIATITGFKTIHHFTRMFHDLEGLTPGQWRDREKQGIRKGIFLNESFKNQNIINANSNKAETGK